jgi:hypothetical protein
VILRVGRALRVQHGDVLYHQGVGPKGSGGFSGSPCSLHSHSRSPCDIEPRKSDAARTSSSEVLLEKYSEVRGRRLTGCSTRSRLLRPPLAGRSAPRFEKRAFITAERQARLNDSPQKTTTIQTTPLRAASSSYCRILSPLRAHWSAILPALATSQGASEGASSERTEKRPNPRGGDRTH